MSEDAPETSPPLRPRRTPWRSRHFWRWYRYDVTLITLYLSFEVVSGFITGNWVNMLTVLAMCILLVSIVLRSMSAYRVGFLMGVQAIPLAMGQPNAAAANELIERSSELWDPSPVVVAHQMEIERLEQEVNRGHAGP